LALGQAYEQAAKMRKAPTYAPSVESLAEIQPELSPLH